MPQNDTNYQRGKNTVIKKEEKNYQAQWCEFNCTKQ